MREKDTLEYQEYLANRLIKCPTCGKALREDEIVNVRIDNTPDYKEVCCECGNDVVVGLDYYYYETIEEYLERKG